MGCEAAAIGRMPALLPSIYNGRSDEGRARFAYLQNILAMVQTSLSDRLAERLASEIHAVSSQVLAAVELLDSGATVPFIARYRKEATGGLSDDQLRLLVERLVYLRELEDRREVVIAALNAQGKLTESLRADIEAADTKQRLEDLYAPYKLKRRTRAMMAREAGLEPLCDKLLAFRLLEPHEAALAFVNPGAGFADADSVLAGARDILAERFSLDPTLREKLRCYMSRHGDVVSHVAHGFDEAASQTDGEAIKFRDYFNYRESYERVPSHRALALFRGRREGYLDLSIELDEAAESSARHPCEVLIGEYFDIGDADRPTDEWLRGVCRWAWRVKSRAAVENDLFEALQERAEETAITVFGDNLKDLLLAAPAGHYAVVGLDPGFRTGVKLAVIDGTGRVLAHDVLMMHSSKAQLEVAKEKLARYIRMSKAAFVAIGNGTASRETAHVVNEVLKAEPSLGARRVIVSEAGASVYSASALAAQELPELDVSYRGAVSIARRLQDPLAELVKIEPKAIGVGQYQHDVDAGKLERRLNAVVEDCVNFVGVDVNTASAELLGYVAGLTKRVAKEIVDFREAHGPFADRTQLLRVPYLGNARFEQAAGFLRIPHGRNPLDATGVHPEAYQLVEKLLQRCGCSSIRDVMGNVAFLRSLRPADFADEHFGVPTVVDILKELEKPGRDPRSEFKTASFDETVQSIEDLRVGMKLEGVVSNVAAFGAFIDIGVHDNGLVHVSAMADRFVKDPREVVKVGDVVKVTVTDVDLKRRRIALSMRSDGKSAVSVGQTASREDTRKRGLRESKREQTALGAAFAALKR